MLCNRLVILKIENVPEANCTKGEMPGAKCTGGEVTQGRTTGEEKLGAKCS